MHVATEHEPHPAAVAAAQNLSRSSGTMAIGTVTSFTTLASSREKPDVKSGRRGVQVNCGASRG